MGFAIAISYWFAWCIACAGAVVVVDGFLAPFWPALNEHSPFYSAYISLAVKVIIIWGMIIINMLGIQLVGRIQLITSLLKIIPLLLICIVGISKVHWSNLTQYYNISGTSNWHAITGAAAVTLWAFTGLEAAVVPSDDVKTHKIVAYATVFGMILTSLIYILITIVILGVTPATVVKNSVSPFNDIATQLFGPSAAYWIAACAIITIVGSINGGILILAQDAMAAARNQLLPKLFAVGANRFKTPIKSLLLSGILMTVLLMMTMNKSLNKQFNFLILLSTLSLLIPYFVSSTAALVLMMKEKTYYSRRHFIYVFFIASLSSLYAFWTFIGVGEDVFFYGCLFFFATFWLHFIYKWYQWHNS
jgi:basic amino acid/polyamine antiporter, APA family